MDGLKIFFAWLFAFSIICVILVMFVPSCTGLIHVYNRWDADMDLKTYEHTELSVVKRKEIEGKKTLAEAEWNRKIQVYDAQAKQEAAKALAQVEIERAKGIAEANRIIGNSLHDNEGYLRYLWIQGLQSQTNSTIYIPTEAGLPILEANRIKPKNEKEPTN